MRLVVLILSFFLSQCSIYDFSRPITQQGNLISSARVARLKVGMSKEEVAILMGTSLLSPSFDASRWDYAYTWKKGNGLMKLKYVSLYFKNNTLHRIEQKNDKTSR